MTDVLPTAARLCHSRRRHRRHHRDLRCDEVLSQSVSPVVSQQRQQHHQHRTMDQEDLPLPAGFRRLLPQRNKRGAPVDPDAEVAALTASEPPELRWLDPALLGALRRRSSPSAASSSTPSEIEGPPRGMGVIEYLMRRVLSLTPLGTLADARINCDNMSTAPYMLVVEVDAPSRHVLMLSTGAAARSLDRQLSDREFNTVSSRQRAVAQSQLGEYVRDGKLSQRRRRAFRAERDDLPIHVRRVWPAHMLHWTDHLAEAGYPTLGAVDSNTRYAMSPDMCKPFLWMDNYEEVLEEGAALGGGDGVQQIGCFTREQLRTAVEQYRQWTTQFFQLDRRFDIELDAALNQALDRRRAELEEAAAAEERRREQQHQAHLARHRLRARTELAHLFEHAEALGELRQRRLVAEFEAMMIERQSLDTYRQQLCLVHSWLVQKAQSLGIGAGAGEGEGEGETGAEEAVEEREGGEEGGEASVVPAPVSLPTTPPLRLPPQYQQKKEGQERKEKGREEERGGEASVKRVCVLPPALPMATSVDVGAYPDSVEVDQAASSLYAEAAHRAAADFDTTSTSLMLSMTEAGVYQSAGMAHSDNNGVGWPFD